MHFECYYYYGFTWSCLPDIYLSAGRGCTSGCNQVGILLAITGVLQGVPPCLADTTTGHGSAFHCWSETCLWMQGKLAMRSSVSTSVTSNIEHVVPGLMKCGRSLSASERFGTCTFQETTIPGRAEIIAPSKSTPQGLNKQARVNKTK